MKIYIFLFLLFLSVLAAQDSDFQSVSSLLEQTLSEMRVLQEKKQDKSAIDLASEVESKLPLFEDLPLKEKNLFIRMRRMRGESFLHQGKYSESLPDTEFVYKENPKPVIFDYTRYAFSLYHSGREKEAYFILNKARTIFKHENDKKILDKTMQILFPGKNYLQDSNRDVP